MLFSNQVSSSAFAVFPGPPRDRDTSIDGWGERDRETEVTMCMHGEDEGREDGAEGKREPSNRGSYGGETKRWRMELEVSAEVW
ncbi:hypothetical protein EXN66_Car004773 [Channa argus]|uniref:Uncharacterized protein n=1 Tax=Channa argus TaxID=215402 RepID=A0A6G1PFK6_CHAAH|nr:hypothetical protein EXN66_Car004773 [Channa argus]